MGLLDAVQGQLDQSAVTQISQKLGINPALAQTAVAAAVPMIVAGMAKHASNPGGAQSIQEAAQKNQDVPDNIDTVLAAGPPVDNTGMLGNILGPHHETVKSGVQQATGLDREKAGKLLLMLSPIVLGVLARKQFGDQNAQAQSPQNLRSTLEQESAAAQQQVQAQAPQVSSLLGNLFTTSS
ncbi:MAG TPA: DUF937 domain-containing protein [Gemmatimonadaceae bacterium]